jgi:hypothetical protein
MQGNGWEGGKAISRRFKRGVPPHHPTSKHSDFNLPSLPEGPGGLIARMSCRKLLKVKSSRDFYSSSTYQSRTLSIKEGYYVVDEYFRCKIVWNQSFNLDRRERCRRNDLIQGLLTIAQTSQNWRQRGNKETGYIGNMVYGKPGIFR